MEREGIRRARAELAKADLVLAVLDDRDADTAIARLSDELAKPQAAGGGAVAMPARPAVLWLHTHADLTGATGRDETRDDGRHLWLNTPRGGGLDALRAALREAAGASEDTSLADGAAGAFSARARHVEAIARAGVHLADAAVQLRRRQGELAAEDLRLAQEALGEITGRVGSDALLGHIFSSFCIGK